MVTTVVNIKEKSFTKQSHLKIAQIIQSVTKEITKNKLRIF